MVQLVAAKLRGALVYLAYPGSAPDAKARRALAQQVRRGRG